MLLMAGWLLTPGSGLRAPGFGPTLIAFAVCVLVACTDQAAPTDPDALSGFHVEIIDDSALGQSPYEFTPVYTPVHLSIQALLADGGIKEDYTGTVQVRIVPGDIDPATKFVRLE